ncbi:MAG: cyclopropane-fatty-acyl-phospholipid synthase family protein [Alphaproteobacteria bacterium]
MLFESFLRFALREGAVRFVDQNGRIRYLGDGSAPCCTLRQHGSFGLKLLRDPPLAMSEAYMDGLLDVEDGTIRDFLDILMRNYARLERHPFMVAGRWLWLQGNRLGQYNPMRRARRNVAHHYDLRGELYELFLDRDMQYSCAYFRDPHDSLETAQENKKHHIAGKLLLTRPGLKVLDIGSGWGGLALYLAQSADADVTGVTLSTEQQAVSEKRAAESGMSSCVRFFLRDYREDQGVYDRIVSVGMFEHVGRRNYGEFFQKAASLLGDNGIMLLHSIGRSDPPAPVNAFIRKYIFPGGDLPSLSDVMAAAERSGLLVTDIEILRLHYANTLREWHRRFAANRDKVKRMFDERFCRMWELYLIGSEMSFRHQNIMVFQLQLAKRQDTVPLTRDYITDFDRERAAQNSIAAE